MTATNRTNLIHVGVRVVAVAAVACFALPAGVASASSPASVPASSERTASAVLETLPVKGRGPMTGYSREQFGPSWKDVDRNGCDTRNDILARDLVERTMDGRCKVLTGVLYPDPYTARNITFTRGKSTIDIDHVVALGNAWVTGAARLSLEQRTALANDPLNLLAVDYSANRQKSDADAATWLPANKAYRCPYVARQIAVKSKYRLYVTAAEKSAMQRVLSTCPNEKIPTNSTLPAPVPVSKPSATPAPSPSSPSGYYRTCSDARAAGVTPLRAGTAAYDANRHLDRDGDGVACE